MKPARRRDFACPASISPLLSGSDNAHNFLSLHHGIRSQLACALQLSRLLANRKRLGGPFHQRLHHRHLPVRRIPGKTQALIADCATCRCTRVPATTFFPSGGWTQRGTKALGAAASLPL